MLTIKNRAGNGLLMMLALSAVLVGCAPAGPRALLEGKRLVEKGKYTQAIEKLRAAAPLLSTNALACNYLGLAYHHAGQYIEAEKAYRQALYLNRNLTEVHYNLGCLWLDQNHVDKAKTEFTAYTLSRANSAEGLVKLGLVQLRMRELGAAETSFKEALRFSPQNPEAWNGLGLTRLQRSQAGEAAQAFNSALQQQADYRPALLNLAIVSQQHLKDRRTALQKYREYLALKPAPADAEAVAAVVRQLEQEVNPPAHAAAANAAAPAPTKTSSNPATRLASPAKTQPVSKPIAAANLSRPAPVANASKPAKAASTLASGAEPAAAGNVETVTLPDEPALKAAEDVSTASVRSHTASAEVSTGTSSQPAGAAAAKSAKRSLMQRMNPLSLFGSEDKAVARSTSPVNGTETGTGGEATSPVTAAGVRYEYKSLAKPAAGNRAEAERSFALGVQAQKARKPSEAMRAYRTATQQDPAFFNAYYNLGVAATDAGELPTALAAYERALAIQPESLDTRYNFALVLKQANYVTDAVNELEKVVVAHPNEARARLALGNLYAQELHLPAKARLHYLKVLELEPRHPQAGAIRYWLAENR